MTFLAGVDATEFSFDADAIVRLLVAGALGAAVGLEREAGDQAAGLRTHIAVALGAATFGVVSTLGFLEFGAARATTNVNVDVTRVASNVAVGVGFLGAGVIFRSGNSIRNLTTAASLWTVAAIGLACGTGDVGIAATATGVLLVSLVLLRPARDAVRGRFADTSLDVRVHLTPEADVHWFLERLDERTDVRIDNIFLEKQEGRLVVAATVSGHPDQIRHWLTRMATGADVETLVQA